MCMEYSMHCTGFNCSHTQITFKVLTSLSIVTILCKCFNISYIDIIIIRKHEETSRISVYWPCCIFCPKPTRCSLRKSKNQIFLGEDFPLDPPYIAVCLCTELAPLKLYFHNMPPLLIFLNATLERLSTK